MSRIPLPLAVDDITALAKQLRSRLTEAPTPPSHLEMLNWLAKAAGFKNFQHFRASVRPACSGATDAVVQPSAQPAPEVVDQPRLKRLLRLYDADGRLARWPSKRGMQLTCLWTLWAALPARTVFDEPTVTGLLAKAQDFGDPVLVRRELCDLGLLWRTPDCRAYRRVERKPPADAVALIHHLHAAAVRPSARPAA